MSTNPKYIRFDLNKRPLGNKTDSYSVVNIENRGEIGIIRWYGAFRKYSFFPNSNTVYESVCLQDIADFLNKLMEDRKKEHQ